jgi:hypothetical protein
VMSVRRARSSRSTNIACVTLTIHQCETALVRQVHHPRALQFPRDGWTRDFPALYSSRLLAPKTGRLDKRQSSQSIPLHQCAVNAVLAGTCKLYLAPRPIAPPSIAVTAENTFNGRTSIRAVRRGCSHLQLVAFLLTPKSDTIRRARH